MPIEISRKTSVRRIYAPNDETTYVDLKVIDEITFMDEKSGFQESVVRLSNNLDADRRVEIAEIGDDKLKVERILKIGHLDEKDGFQQTVFTLNNQPPTHQKTHKTKVYALNADRKTKNTDVWVEVERVEEFAFLDEREGFQETIFTLAKPDIDDTEWDYKDLTTPEYDGHKGDFPINPPYRLDPYQNIVDANFTSDYWLVLYGANKIAAVTVDSKGKFKAVLKKTLTQSNWEYPEEWYSTWFTINTPKNFLKTGQVKISKQLHAMSCPISIDNYVISINETQEMAPMYNVADTLNKYAMCSTFGKDEGWTGVDFGPANNQQMNGSGTTVYNTYMDKFTWSKAEGIKKVSSKTTVYVNQYVWYPLAALEPDGDGWSNICAFGDATGTNFGGWSEPWTDWQNDAYSDFRQTAGWLELSRYGPGDYGFGGSSCDPWGGEGSFYCELTTKIMIRSKVNALDVITLTDLTASYARTTGDNGSTTTTTYNGVASVHTSGVGGTTSDYSALRWIGWPFATKATHDGGYYWRQIYENVDADPVFHYVYNTPYEEWQTDSYTSGNFPGQPVTADYDLWFTGWLQVSDGKHMVQGYIKNGVKRLYMDGTTDIKSALNTAIGCGAEDIATIIMGVKMADITKLK